MSDKGRHRDLAVHAARLAHLSAVTSAMHGGHRVGKGEHMGFSVCDHQDCELVRTDSLWGPWDCGDQPCAVDRPFTSPIARRLDEILRRTDYSASRDWHDTIREYVLAIERGTAS